MTQTANRDKPCILVVDDSRVVRKSILRVLDGVFDTVEASNGAAAWTALANDSRIEVVITDITMPEMDGYELICKVRAVEDPGLRDIPMIVITSAEDDITRDRAYACGANDFILKPIDAQQLLHCVKAQLKDYQDMTGTIEPTLAAAKVSVIPNTNAGTLKDAIQHLNTGLKILSSLKTATIAPHALSLVLRLMPLLKFCNAKFALGMDSEIATFQQRLNGARETLQAKSA